MMQTTAEIAEAIDTVTARMETAECLLLRLREITASLEARLERCEDFIDPAGTAVTEKRIPREVYPLVAGFDETAATGDEEY